MRSAGHTVRRRLASQDGFTLVELLVSAMLGLIVFAATMSLLVVAWHQQASSTTRVSQLETARTGEERLARELRQASVVSLNNSASISYTSRGTAVTWACASQTCTRTVSGVGTTAATNVVNTDIFTLTNGNYVTINLTVSGAGHGNVTINDSAALRNLGTSTS